MYAGEDPLTGKDLYLTASAPTEREAEKIRTRLLSDVDAKRNASTKGTLNTALDKWLSIHEVEETTLEGYRGHLDRVGDGEDELRQAVPFEAEIPLDRGCPP